MPTLRGAGKPTVTKKMDFFFRNLQINFKFTVVITLIFWKCIDICIYKNQHIYANTKNLKFLFKFGGGRSESSQAFPFMIGKYEVHSKSISLFFFPIKTNTTWTKSFGWEVMTCFLLMCKNFHTRKTASVSGCYA